MIKYFSFGLFGHNSMWKRKMMTETIDAGNLDVNILRN